MPLLDLQQQEFKLKLKKRLVFLLLSYLLSLPQISRADSAALYIGPSMESLTFEDDTASRTAITGFFGEYDLHLFSGFHLGLGANAQVSINTMSTVSFGLYSSLRYDLLGQVHYPSAQSGDASIRLYKTYAVYLNFGLFQKFLEFESIPDVSNVGGVLFGVGGIYNSSDKFYYSVIIQTLMSGSAPLPQYTSMEFYLGLGMRF